MKRQKSKINKTKKIIIALIIIVAVLIIVWFVTNKLSSRADTSKFEPQYDSNTTDSTCRELPGSIDVIAKLETTSEEVESLIKEVGGSINEKSEYQSEHNFSISVPIGREKEVIKLLKGNPNIEFVEPTKVGCVYLQ